MANKINNIYDVDFIGYFIRIVSLFPLPCAFPRTNQPLVADLAALGIAVAMSASLTSSYFSLLTTLIPLVADSFDAMPCLTVLGQIA